MRSFGESADGCVVKGDRIPSLTAIVASNQVMVDRGAFWCATTDASRFDALLPPGPLVPELPTVLDLRQELPNSIDIALGPEMNGDAAGRDGLGCRDFLRGDVAAERCGGHAQLLSSVARGKSRHQLQCDR